MLLLMIKAELEKRRDRTPRVTTSADEKICHRPVDMRAVAGDVGEARPRQHPARGTRMARPRAFVIGIEEVPVSRIVGAIIPAKGIRMKFSKNQVT